MWWEIQPSQSPRPPPHKVSKHTMLSKEDCSCARKLQLNRCQCFLSACSVQLKMNVATMQRKDVTTSATREVTPTVVPVLMATSLARTKNSASR